MEASVLKNIIEANTDSQNEQTRFHQSKRAYCKSHVFYTHNLNFNLMKLKLLMPFLLFTVLILAGSCGKSDAPDVPGNNDEEIKQNLALLEETTGQIEKALSAGDPAAFLGFVSPDYEKYYKDAVQANATKLVQFADIFKTRKLLTCNGFYAVYEVQYNGKKFEISMILDDEGKWKIKDL